jgi:transposase
METAALVTAYGEGLSVREVARLFDVHPTTVLALQRAEVSRRPHLRKLSNDDVHFAAECYRNGESLETVAGRFDVNAATIRREFTKAGIPVRTRRGWVGLPA